MKLSWRSTQLILGGIAMAALCWFERGWSSEWMTKMELWEFVAGIVVILLIWLKGSD